MAGQPLVTEPIKDFAFDRGIGHAENAHSRTMDNFREASQGFCNALDAPFNENLQDRRKKPENLETHLNKAFKSFQGKLGQLAGDRETFDDEKAIEEVVNLAKLLDEGARPNQMPKFSEEEKIIAQFAEIIPSEEVRLQKFLNDCPDKHNAAGLREFQEAQHDFDFVAEFDKNIKREAYKHWCRKQKPPRKFNEEEFGRSCEELPPDQAEEEEKEENTIKKKVDDFYAQNPRAKAALESDACKDFQKRRQQAHERFVGKKEADRKAGEKDASMLAAVTESFENRHVAYANLARLVTMMSAEDRHKLIGKAGGLAEGTSIVNYCNFLLNKTRAEHDEIFKLKGAQIEAGNRIVLRVGGRAGTVKIYAQIMAEEARNISGGGDAGRKRTIYGTTEEGLMVFLRAHTLACHEITVDQQSKDRHLRNLSPKAVAMMGISEQMTQLVQQNPDLPPGRLFAKLMSAASNITFPGKTGQESIKAVSAMMTDLFYDHGALHMAEYIGGVLDEKREPTLKAIEDAERIIGKKRQEIVQEQKKLLELERKGDAVFLAPDKPTYELNISEARTAIQTQENIIKTKEAEQKISSDENPFNFVINKARAGLVNQATRGDVSVIASVVPHLNAAGTLYAFEALTTQLDSKWRDRQIVGSLARLHESGEEKRLRTFCENLNVERPGQSAELARDLAKKAINSPGGLGKADDVGLVMRYMKNNHDRTEFLKAYRAALVDTLSKPYIDDPKKMKDLFKHNAAEDLENPELKDLPPEKREALHAEYKRLFGEGSEPDLGIVTEDKRVIDGSVVLTRQHQIDALAKNLASVQGRVTSHLVEAVAVTGKPTAFFRWDDRKETARTLIEETVKMHADALREIDPDPDAERARSRSLAAGLVKRSLSDALGRDSHWKDVAADNQTRAHADFMSHRP